MFVLPNLFTLCSIFCGFYGIAIGVAGADTRLAALAVFVGMLLDLFDGRVARLTRTQSEFGRQLDSLADLISFGTAPAVLIYVWGLQPLGTLGLLAAFIYVACGAIRLARFNVLAAQPKPEGPTATAPSPKYSVGLPIPPAAGIIVGVILSVPPTSEPPWTWVLAAGLAALGVLMVSSVHYRTFKDLRPTRRALLTVSGLLMVFGTLAVWVSPAISLLFIFVGYAASGLLEETWWLLRSRSSISVPATDVLGLLEK